MKPKQISKPRRGNTTLPTVAIFIAATLASGFVLLYLAGYLGGNYMWIVGIIGVVLGIYVAFAANPPMGFAIALGSSLVVFGVGFGGLDLQTLMLIMSLAVLLFIAGALMSSRIDIPGESGRYFRGAATIARIIVVIVVAALAYLILWPTLSGWSISLMGFTIPVGVLAFFILIVWALSKAV